MRFTGQEDQAPDFGIPYTDFGARHYSPALSRWLVPDPLGEKYYDISPYAYCAGNPENFVDDGGKAVHIVAGAVLGGVVNGGIALYQGKTGKDFWGAVAGGAVFGAITTATGGMSLAATGESTILRGTISGAIGGTFGSLAEQGISFGEVEIGRTINDGVSGAIAGAAVSRIRSLIEVGRTNAFHAIENKYNSAAMHNRIHKEIVSEFKNTGRKLSGNTTKRQLDQATSDRVKILSESDKAFVKGSFKIVDKVQEQSIGWGIDQLANWNYEKYKD